MKKRIAWAMVLLGLCAGVAHAQSITTLVTNTLNEPYAVAVDQGGDSVYITDSANHRIARYRVQSGELTTFAGKNGEFGANDGTLASAHFFDPKGMVFARGGLVVADSGNHAIRFIDLTNKTVITLAGTLGRGGAADGAGTAASFRNPRGLAADTSGNVYVADTRNGLIRMLDTNNNVTTLARGLSGPSGVALSDSGQIYVVDRSDDTIKVIKSGVVTVYAGSGIQGTNDGDGLSASFSLPESALWFGSNFGLLVADSGNHTIRQITETNGVTFVSTYAGLPGVSGRVDGALNVGRFNSPVGFSRYSTGFLIVDEANSAVRQILVSAQLPPISDPRIGQIIESFDPDRMKFVLKLIPVVDEVFQNDVTIGITGESGGPQTFFTFGQSRASIFDPDLVPDPSTNNATPPAFAEGSDPADKPESLLASPAQDVTIKAISMQEGRVSSKIVRARFRFEVSAPKIEGGNPAALTLKSSTLGSTLWYTTNGSDPTDGADTNPNSQGPVASGDKISLSLGKTNTVLKVKAFKLNYKPSPVATLELSVTNFTPNRISLGFAGGEGSSAFIAAAGQTFYSPITLTLLPAQTMYGLQFNVQVTPGTGPAPATNSDYQLRFQSMLQKINNGGVILPMAFSGASTVVTALGGGVFITNTVASFTNLLVTNLNSALLGVGWLERNGQTNLYNTRIQDLIVNSQAHDTLFESGNGKVVVGGFSFVVPTNALAGHTYRVEIGRPSATEDGITTDIFIESPDGTDPNVPIFGIRNLTVGNRTYIVGDVAPFQWFNAGDFGNTNILNNDILQVFQSAMEIYNLNAPPSGSDLEDAMDTCCVSTNGTNLGTTSFNPFDGSDTTINQVGFGDGVIDVRDVFVNFRRALDPSLAWYARYWSNGVLQAVVVSNVFRGLPNVSAERISSRQANLAAEQISDPQPPAVAFSADTAAGVAGQTLSIPIRASITGSYPLRFLMLGVKVEPLGDGVLPASAPRFLSTSALGNPTYTGVRSDYQSAVWLNESTAGLTGEQVIGQLEVTIPAGAPAYSVYRVSFNHPSASPNGFGAFSVSTTDGIITMKNRSTGFDDGIPDEWRIVYFGSISSPSAHGLSDPDGDGMNNLMEYRAGTNPTDPQSRLQLKAQSSPTGVTLRWPSVAGKRYILESSSNLGSFWTVIASGLTGTGSEMEFTDASSAKAVQFYRIRLLE